MHYVDSNIDPLTPAPQFKIDIAAAAVGTRTHLFSFVVIEYKPNGRRCNMCTYAPNTVGRPQLGYGGRLIILITEFIVPN